MDFVFNIFTLIIIVVLVYILPAFIFALIIKKILKKKISKGWCFFLSAISFLFSGIILFLIGFNWNDLGIIWKIITLSAVWATISMLLFDYSNPSIMNDEKELKAKHDFFKDKESNVTEINAENINEKKITSVKKIKQNEKMKKGDSSYYIISIYLLMGLSIMPICGILALLNNLHCETVTYICLAPAIFFFGFFMFIKTFKFTEKKIKKYILWKKNNSGIKIKIADCISSIFAFILYMVHVIVLMICCNF